MHPADRRYQGFPDFASWAECRVADDLWDTTLQSLGRRRAAADTGAFAILAEQATRMAAIDTGAIEGLYAVDRGFTMSVAAMASGWEAQIQREKGPDVAALVTAQRAAYDLALDLATHQSEMSEVWIRELHQAVCGAQDTYDVQTAAGPQRHPLPKGTYKRSPNHVVLADGSTHEYAPVEDTPEEMYRLVTELRSPAFLGAHPALQASFAHYGFVCVHPFADGNGRVARALASVYTLRATSLPLVIFADQRFAYLKALEEADGSRMQTFVDFILFRAVDLEQLVAEQLAEVAAVPVEAAARRLDVLGDRHDAPEVTRLRAHIRSEIEAQLTALQLPESVLWDVAMGEVTLPYEPGLVLRLRVNRGWGAEVRLRVTIGSNPFDGGPPGTYPVFCDTDRRQRLDVRPDELTPFVTKTLDLRLSAWLRRNLGEALDKLADLAGDLT